METGIKIAYPLAFDCKKELVEGSGAQLETVGVLNLKFVVVNIGGRMR